ncbi:AfsR/SARP family transcriptional regulator [Catenuloplanes atrovinosus]|uniref:DNA-binding SARP family transcriptional activator n=1 Tax=Catenuloplanes atrovinosus TaxID=137266 RepID=A0AAE3YQI0_9ACTN|nr:AfsR/SARP family transcriptional regulator [Catenuloplanes atrovinosus]MDR7276797.1 DNA-binding SARP family transcriptional activator [Catenuloplanes atrovinosus]
MAHFRVLGPIELTHDGRILTPTPPKVRTVLALLLLRANRVVTVDALIREIWGDEPTRSAVTTVQTYVYHLRKQFSRERLDVPIESIGGGYRLVLAPGRLDLDAFARLLDSGRDALHDDRPAEAATALRAALDVWRGGPLGDVTLGRALSAHATHLEEQRIRAIELRIQADVALGRGRELIGELRYLVAMHPLNEWFHQQLIAVLGRAGRRGEALQSYHRLRTVLRDELGIDPSPEVQRLHRDVLGAGSSGMRSAV